MLKELKIGKVTAQNNLYLAPMAGFTDVGFRSVCKSYGAGLTCTELISAKALYYGDKKTEQLCATAPNESPKVLQLFGNEPKIFEAVLKLPIVQKFDIIDINMGCPAPKIVKNGEGSALLGKFALAEEIIRICVSSTNKPITVKFRSGLTPNSIVAVEFAKMCERAGASAITFHPRTTDQGFGGKADWELFKSVRKAVTIPLIASGDIVDATGARYLLEEVKVDGLMIGRAALGNPIIFKELITGVKLDYTDEDKKKDIFAQIEVLKQVFTPDYICANIKKQLLYYFKRKSASVKNAISRCTKLEDMEKLIAEI